MLESSADTVVRCPALKQLETLSILPTFPLCNNPFARPTRAFMFGIQLIPATPHLRSLTIGLPLDICTNKTSRQHLKSLALTELKISLCHLSPSLLGELNDLLLTPPSEATEEDEGFAFQRLSLSTASTTQVVPSPRFERLSVRLVPNYVDPLPSPAVFLSAPLRSFPRLDIYLPRVATLAKLPYEGQTEPDLSFSQRLLDLVALDDEMRDKMQIFLISIDDEDENERIWPYISETEKEQMEADQAMMEERRRRRDTKSKETWERQVRDLCFLGEIRYICKLKLKLELFPQSLDVP